jgi:hypothetical protein
MFVALPGLPDDFVTVGDELDLFAYARSMAFTPVVQTVVLARGNELVVFTVNMNPVDRGRHPHPYRRHDAHL